MISYKLQSGDIVLLFSDRSRHRLQPNCRLKSIPCPAGTPWKAVLTASLSCWRTWRDRPQRDHH
ncbi:MAG: hypothetical protein ACTFAL_00100 [Candidatus Electronema sp. V4]|uniref:hypothetical protein n=1 Tax=Candidatus Electronema sp. V4 TaxID=3454756 RepID=UPI0040558C9D